MGSKEHDDIIKQKLSSLENKHRTPDWNHFSSMLDDINEKDLEFDLKIRQKLSKLSEKIYVRPEWNKLYRIITERAARRKKVLVTKCAEAIILLLFFFTSYNLLTVYQNSKSSVVKKSLQFAINQESSVKRTMDYLDIESVPQSNKESTYLNVLENAEQHSGKSSGTVLIKQYNKERSFDIISSKKLNSPIQPISSEVLKSSFVQNSRWNKRHLNLSPVDTQNEIPSTRIDVPNLNRSLVIQPGVNNIATPVEILASEKNSFWKKLQIGAFLANKLNYITIPSKKNFLFDRKQEFINTDLSGGVLAEYKHKNFSLSMGLGYTRIRYELKASALEGSFLTSYQLTTLNSINYDFISMPVDVKYYVYETNGWNFSVFTGIGIDVLGTSEYVLKVSSNQSSAIVQPNDLNSTSRLASLNYQTGVLDSNQRASNFNSSNKIMDNLYTKVRIGLGLQKQLNSSFGIFTDFIYQHQVDKERGVGPNFDLIDSYSINMGLKYRLG